MLERNAKTLRDVFLVLALADFAFGVIDVVMLAFNFSLRTGLMLKMGLHPHSFAEAGIFLVLTSIAFGVIELNHSAR